MLVRARKTSKKERTRTIKPIIRKINAELVLFKDVLVDELFYSHNHHKWMKKVRVVNERYESVVKAGIIHEQGREAKINYFPRKCHVVVMR